MSDKEQPEQETVQGIGQEEDMAEGFDFDNFTRTPVEELPVKIARLKLDRVLLEDALNSAKDAVAIEDARLRKQVSDTEGLKNAEARTAELMTLKTSDEKFIEATRQMRQVMGNIASCDALIEFARLKYGMFFNRGY